MEIPIIEQYTADVVFLLARANNSGRIRFGCRDTGISSNSIVNIAYGITDLSEQELPSDRFDLDACRLMWEKLPEHRKTPNAWAALTLANTAIAEKEKAKK